MLSFENKLDSALIRHVLHKRSRKARYISIMTILSHYFHSFSFSNVASKYFEGNLTPKNSLIIKLFCGILYL